MPARQISETSVLHEKHVTLQIQCSFGVDETLLFEMSRLLKNTCTNKNVFRVYGLNVFLTIQFCQQGRTPKLGRACLDCGRRPFQNKVFYVYETVYFCKTFCFA
jgi:alpha-glucuronidase